MEPLIKKLNRKVIFILNRNIRKGFRDNDSAKTDNYLLFIRDNPNFTVMNSISTWLEVTL